MKFNVNNFTLIKNVVGTTPALGSWYINELSISLIMMSIVVAIIYKVKFDDMLDSFYDGIKKYLPVALIALLANLILVAVTYHAFFPTIVEWAMNLTKSFNIITTSLVAFVGGIINVDIGYLATMTLPTITGIISDTSVYPIISVIYQFMYGLAMFVAPTSLILIMTLTYLKIPYNKWLSYIWKFILQLLVILLVAIVVVTIV